jgi:hypothetical protein
MTNTVTPTYTDNVSVVAATTLARGSIVRGTLDLRSKVGAYLFIKLARQGTTGLTNGIDVLVRRVLNNDAATPGGAHPGGIALLSGIAACNGNTVVNGTCGPSSTGYEAELITLVTTNFAPGDLICIEAADHSRLEFHRISKATIHAGTGLTLDRWLQYDHTAAQADTVRNKADAFAPLWVTGGALYEVVFDYGDDAAGESVTVQCKAQTYDSDTIA